MLAARRRARYGYLLLLHVLLSGLGAAQRRLRSYSSAQAPGGTVPSGPIAGDLELGV
jgi:hypothetical protein